MKCEEPMRPKCSLPIRHILNSIKLGFLTDDTIKRSARFELMKQLTTSESESHDRNFRNFEEELRWLCKQFDLEQNKRMFSQMEGIPFILIKIFGRMDRETYNKLIHRPDFFELEIPVCENCYIGLTEYMISEKCQRDKQ